MSRTLVSTTIDRIRRQLSSGYRNEINVLASPVTTGDTTLLFQFDLAANLIPGSSLSIGTELMRVMTVNKTNKSCTVIRAFHDSVATSHSAGAEVWVNSRFTGMDIWDAMQDEIASYGPQLYRVTSVRLALTGTQITVELPASLVGTYGIIDVNRFADDAQYSSAELAWPRAEVRLIRYDAATWTEFPTSGMVLRLLQPVSTGALLVKAAMPFVAPTALSDDLVATCGLAPSMMDVLSMGVRLRLLQEDETGMSARTTQDEPRRAVELPPGSQVQPQQLSLALYRSRRNDEANKLRSVHPIRYA